LVVRSDDMHPDVVSHRLSPEQMGTFTAAVRQSMTELHQQVDVSRTEMRERARNRRGGRPVNFDAGDYVMLASLSGRVAGTGGASTSKLRAKWAGPMRVVSTVGPLLYEVECLLTGDMHTVHAQRLQFYHDASLHVTDEMLVQQQHDASGFFVESLLAHHRDTKGVWWLTVQWLGFESHDSTDEPLFQLYQDVPGKVKQYLRACAAGRDVSSMSRALQRRFSAFRL
jgi:hypothetical protein